MDTRTPIALIDTLDEGAILERLQEIDREAKALRVLLRAVRARQPRRGTGRARVPTRQEVARGS